MSIVTKKQLILNIDESIDDNANSIRLTTTSMALLGFLVGVVVDCCTAVVVVDGVTVGVIPVGIKLQLSISEQNMH